MFQPQDYLKLFEAGEASLREGGADLEDLLIKMELITGIAQVEGVSREYVEVLGLAYVTAGLDGVRNFVGQK